MIAEDLIKKEIRSWSRDVLEVPSSSFNGFSPCPYAKRAWNKEMVDVLVTDQLDCVDRIKNQNPPKGEQVKLVAWTGWEDVSADEFSEWMDKENENHQGVWLIGFHPESEEDEQIEEWEGEDAPSYAVILIQSLEHLQRTSKSLMSRGYYNLHPQNEVKLVTRRNSLC
tara:strand:- start:838 stop:1341 length:504 start_codon:yes stop_codon:yes gene_type:complete